MPSGKTESISPAWRDSDEIGKMRCPPELHGRAGNERQIETQKPGT